jgi:peroxiredoxin
MIHSQSTPHCIDSTPKNLLGRLLHRQIRCTLLTVTLVLVAFLALGYLFQKPLGEAVDAWTTRNMFVSAEAADFTPGLVMGSHFPGLEAVHQGRRITSIDEFAGNNGTVLVVLRSVDWCLYCKRQMTQLQEYEAYFRMYGIALVAITYDPPDAQQSFIEQHAISIPVLSDEQSMSFRKLGTLNEDDRPADSEYELPRSGMIIINRENVVVGKLFAEIPILRVDSGKGHAEA